MEFKGTQGPWNTVVADSGNAVRVFSWDSTYIGMIGGSDQSHVEISRNARLIAAAPELLQACLAFLARYDNHMVAADLLFSDVADTARAAIAKALGESS